VGLNNFAVITVNANPSDIVISPNSELFAAVFKEKGQVLIYNVKGVQIAKIEDAQTGVSGAIWAPDSLQIIIFN